MKVTELLRESEEKIDYAAGLQAGLDALKKLRPQGTVKMAGVHHAGTTYERHEAEFTYDFEINEHKAHAVMLVDFAKSRGVNQPPCYHFSFAKFKIEGNILGDRGFNPQADSGPFIDDLKTLKKELEFWEKHIVDGMVAQEQRWKADLAKMASKQKRPKKK